MFQTILTYNYSKMIILKAPKPWVQENLFLLAIYNQAHFKPGNQTQLHRLMVKLSLYITQFLLNVNLII